MFNRILIFLGVKKVKAEKKPKNEEPRWDVCDRFDNLKKKINGKTTGDETTFVPDRLNPEI